MAKIEVEIDDELLERLAATGMTLEGVVAEGISNAVSLWEHEASAETIASDERRQREYAAYQEQKKAEWVAATLPDIVESRDALIDGADKFDEELKKNGGRGGRTMRLFFEEKEVEAFAWLELVGRARRGVPGIALKGFRVNLDNPEHWEAARDYVRSLLNRDFHKNWSWLIWGNHRYLRPEPAEQEPEPKAEPKSEGKGRFDDDLPF